MNLIRPVLSLSLYINENKVIFWLVTLEVEGLRFSIAA